MKKICIVGTHQSGSTRVFNLVRLIYKKKGLSVLSGWTPTNLNNIKNYDIVVGKVHDINIDYLNNYDITILPLRNIMDSAISEKKRFPKVTFVESCLSNITLFNKFKPHANFIFKYEDYSINYIKQLTNVLGVKLTNFEIIDIMRILDKMLNSKDIVKKDNHLNHKYKKTLLSQNHNTSGGSSNKFINLPNFNLENMLNHTEIHFFLEEHNYI